MKQKALECKKKKNVRENKLEVYKNTKLKQESFSKVNLGFQLVHLFAQEEAPLRIARPFSGFLEAN